MRAVIQRVHSAAIAIDHKQHRTIDKGLVVFLAVLKGDTEEQVNFLSQKICELRIFNDENNKMNRSLLDVGGEILIVSNFTLSTDCKKGRRPSFDTSAPPAQAEMLYQQFIIAVQNLKVSHVETGEFGAYMDVTVKNDGPVTIMIDTEKIGK